MTQDCSTARKYRDVQPDLPETISLDEIKRKADSLWQQSAAERPPSEGGPVATPVVQVP